MSDLNPPRASTKTEIVAVLAAASNAWAVVALVALLAMLPGCTFDQDKIAKEKGNIRALCEDPLTTPVAQFCKTYVNEGKEGEAAPGQ